MASLHNQTTQLEASLNQHSRTSPGRWLLLGAGSVLVHLLLIYRLGDLQTLGQLDAASEPSATPVELIDLPAPEVVPSVSAQPSAQSATAEPAINPAEAPLNSAANSSRASGSIGIVSADSNPLSQPPVTPPPPRAAVAPATPGADQPAVTQTPQPSIPPDPAPAAPDSPHLAMADRQAEPIATPSPSPSPLITTEQIDVPIPDVSQPWTPPASPSPAGIPAIPRYLTASLTTDPLPVTTEVKPDSAEVAAQPTATSRIFSSNPALSPCPVRREAIAVLGQTVALQVKTDELGQVTETVTQTSSQNAAYDELATCLVKSWKFQPATVQGQAVANGLLVHITIDRS